MSYLLCFGFGYTARCLAYRLQGRGFRIVGTTQPQNYPTFIHSRRRPVASVLPFDRRLPLDSAHFRDVSHVLVSIPPDEIGDPVADLHGRDLIKAAPTWVGYLSTTGVYGDTGGAWIDENAPLRPSIRRSIARAAAERLWLTLWRQNHLPMHLFRLAGIYGRGRSAVDALRNGQAHRVIKPGYVSSRIHVEDLTTILEVSMLKPKPGSIYNVCDDEPAPPQDVITYAAALLDMVPPPMMSWEQAQHVLSSFALTFYANNRRVRNNHIKHELEITLRYPSYREGLVQCL